MGILTFGEKEEGKQYILRPAVYGVLFSHQKDKIAVIQTRSGYFFLPGGGIENNETHGQCLKRETLEELGMEIEIGAFLGCAQQYFYAPHENRDYLNQSYFYLCEIGRKVQEPIEEDHLLNWTEPTHAVKQLYHEHQRWAVQQAIRIETLF